MYSKTFDFYDRTSLKSYNLDENMRYQLSMLDRLDLFTRKHCENVAALTCRLCEKLHCSKGFTEYCTICAYLHDIGKLFIPPAILQKPEKLTDEEYEIMKTHTTLGYKMCFDDLKLRLYATGALNHHEALDGSGYPNGLTKKDIPYEAQIIRVADEYDAIVSKRQYKTHIDISDTLKILIENSHAGKINSKILKKLLKIVIEDIEYEISLTQSYVKDLKSDVKRAELINKYKSSMDRAQNQKQKNYYLNGIKELLKSNESLDSCGSLFEEFSEALKTRISIINNLYNEINIIKKLKI